MISPIKINGKKTKLVEPISNLLESKFKGHRDRLWIEPFTGSGTVGFNLAGETAIFSDVNEHLIDFYTFLQDDMMDAGLVKNALHDMSKNLQKYGEVFYYHVREEFNEQPSSVERTLNFLFLNHTCFNGVMRFNKRVGLMFPSVKTLTDYQILI